MAAVACIAGPLLLIAGSRWRVEAGGRQASKKAAAADQEVSAFAARYEIGKPLGSGTYGKVYRAAGRRCGQEYAVKVVSHTRDAENEVSMQIGLEHPHVARMIESFGEGGKLYMVAEVCNGGELLEALEDHGRFLEQEARAAFVQMMSAVAFLHSRAVAHRDVKMENFLLERQDVPLARNTLKLIDFGFATSFVPGSRCLKTKCGSWGFVAPEVVAGGAYDERCDVYSCGVILHALLCDELPFRETESSAGGCREIAGEISFGGQDVKRSLTRNARKLIAWTLARSVAERPFAPQVLAAEWIQSP